MDTEDATSGPKTELIDMSSCRVCMAQKSKMNSIFDAGSSITDKIEYCTGLQFSEDDGLPSQICDCCLEDLSVAHKFKTSCILANDTFQNILIRKIKTEVELDFQENGDILEDNEGSIKLETVDDLHNEIEEDYDLCTMSQAPKKRGPYKTSGKPRRLKKLKFRRLWCEPCGLKFADKQALDEHKRSSHREKETWICEFCGKVFCHRGSVSSHIRSHRPPEFACAECDYKTWYKHDLTKHTRIHKGEKSYQCVSCPSSYHTSSNLKSHVRRCHERERRFACALCDARFFDRTKFNRHLDSHNNIKRFECEVCHSCFTRRCYWKKHMQRQHNVQVPTQRPGKQKVNALVGLDAPT